VILGLKSTIAGRREAWRRAWAGPRVAGHATEDAQPSRTGLSRSGLNKALSSRIVWRVAPSSESLLAEIESLYRERFADFVAVAASIVGERESAREAVQDAFASVVRTRRDFRREAPLEAWVWRAVINSARKKKQRYVREVHACTTAPAMNGAAPDQEERLDVGVSTLVAALPERQRLALFLRYYADLDYRQIANILGVTTGTVSASLYAAHNTLRQAVSEVNE
jgi:RNA polymerase sigma factor (sigma-70 family)